MSRCRLPRGWLRRAALEQHGHMRCTPRASCHIFSSSCIHSRVLCTTQAGLQRQHQGSHAAHARRVKLEAMHAMHACRQGESGGDCRACKQGNKLNCAYIDSAFFAYTLVIVGITHYTSGDACSTSGRRWPPAD